MGCDNNPNKMKELKASRGGPWLVRYLDGNHGELPGLDLSKLPKYWGWSSHTHFVGILIWLVVSTHLKNISQMGSFLQVGVKTKNIWNHNLVIGI